jgi:GT2 family glycosyltransferase
MLTAYGLKLTAVINNQNAGFAKANNQGIKIATGDYILLLNPDTVMQKGVLENMVDFIEKHNDCGVSGCKILNPDNSVQPSVRRFPTLFSQLFILLKLHHIFNLNKYFAKDFDYTVTQAVDQVMGAFFMIPRKTIDSVGLLDEKFYIWFEEVDYCKRASNANMKVYYVSEASIIHYGGMSFKQRLSLEKQKIFNKSLINYFQKHGTKFEVLILKILNPISLFLAWMSDKLSFNRRRSP